MGSWGGPVAAPLLTALLALLLSDSSALGQDLRETDALCTEDGCFVVYFQRKTFLDSWRACKKKGGDLATVKHRQDAASIAALFSNLDLRHSLTKVQVWVGLQRQPRQCSGTHPLRGFSWTTGDQDTEFTNWQREDLPDTCAVSRCVVIGYNALEQSENFRWLESSCSLPVDGFLCFYRFRGMCLPLQSEGAGHALYATPFNLLSSLLTHVPFGSVATMPCPAGSIEEQSVMCTQKGDGSVDWSIAPPLCSDPPVSQNRCERDNGGCQHYCKPAGVAFYCECADGYQLGADGRSCELSDVCVGSPCESECLPLPDGYRCACPYGYMLAPDEHSCLDVDECLQSPCEQGCVNTPGTFECRCGDGYQLDEVGDCEDVDECSNEPCQHACENTAGSYRCHCHLGYSPMPEDSSQCQDDDECLDPGNCEQMCVNYEGSFECFCMEGFQLMSDQLSCLKIVDGDAATTPLFPLLPGWAPAQYEEWDQETNTDWPLEQKPSLPWITEPASVINHDVIWVTRSPQEDAPLDSHGSKTPQAEDRITDAGQRSVHYTTPPLKTEPTTALDWFEEEEETTTEFPTMSTATVSGGAWNWWAGTTSQEPGDPEHLDRDRSEAEAESDSSRGDTELPQEGRGAEEEDQWIITSSPDPTVSLQLIPLLPTLSVSGGIVGALKPKEGEELKEEDEEEEHKEENNEEQEEMQEGGSWVLVGLLVPLCIFIVLSVVLVIVYCRRFAVQPRHKSPSDCYHWISGAHDKQGTAPPAEGGGNSFI